MTSVFSRGKLLRLRNMYRFAACAAACMLLFCCGLLYFSRCFTADRLSRNFLFAAEPTDAEQKEEAIPPDRGDKPSFDTTDSGNAEDSPDPQETSTAPPNGTDETEPTEDMSPVTEVDLSCTDRFSLRSSETSLAPDVKSLFSRPLPDALKISDTESSPVVLVIHTHATECYLDEDTEKCPSDTSFRTSDTSENMIAVGNAFCAELSSLGISTLHCTEQFDLESYNASYQNSLSAVREYLKKYPSIKYIFDIHRDAIIRDRGEYIKPTCTINGKKTAQVMLVVGTNTQGADHPNWEDNLSLALKIQNELFNSAPHLMRSIDLRGASFNQQYSPGSLLVEIGSCANTLAEAENAARIFANGVGKIILSN